MPTSMPDHAGVQAPSAAHVAPERAGETLQLSPRIVAGAQNRRGDEEMARQDEGRGQGRIRIEFDEDGVRGVRQIDAGLSGAGVHDIQKTDRQNGEGNGAAEEGANGEKKRHDKARLSPILHRSNPSYVSARHGSTSTPTPIRHDSTLNTNTPVNINNNGQPVPRSPNPEFAELLTPAKLRRRRRHIPRVTLPAAIAGPSADGWQTGEDVYRGALNDPTIVPDIPMAIDDEAISLGSTDTSSSSTGSTWSIVSDLERGRRRTVAAIERFGERIGVRRASSASSDHSVGSMLERQQQELRHRSSRRMSQRLTRTLTLTRSRSRRSSIDSAHSAAPRRQYIPRKRQFTLLVDGETTTTPNLANVLARVKELRVQAGLEAPSRGGSAPGRKRPNMARGKTSFVPPPKPVRPLGRLGTQSRLSALRSGAGLSVSPGPSPPITPLATPTAGVTPANGLGPRPLTPAELMGLTSPASAPNLTALREFPSNTIIDPPSKRSSLDTLSPVPVPSPAVTAAAVKPKVTWWLDVGCPTWEDLRDIGELLSLHPLTLEDVLQQDPREKMDVFEPLGYYFIVVRALDETYFKYTPGSSSLASVGKTPPASSAASQVSQGSQVSSNKGPQRGVSGTGPGDAEVDMGIEMDEKKGGGSSPDIAAQHDHAHAKKEGRRRGWGMGRAVGKLAGRQGEKVEIVEDNPGKEGLEGVGVGAVNVYMAVFDDGIITFHYDDISKHTTRVRERVLSGAQQNTSDGLAHGILDSVVDAFFPLVRYVDGEVDDIDSLTIDPTVQPRQGQRGRGNTLRNDGDVDARASGHDAASVRESPDAFGSGRGSRAASLSPEGFAGSGVAANGTGTGLGTGSGTHGTGSAESSYNDEKQRYPPRRFPLPPRLSNPFRLRSRSRSRPANPVNSDASLPYHSATHSRPKSRLSLSTHLPPIPSLRLSLHLPSHLFGLTYIRLFFLPVSSAVRQHPRPLRPSMDRNELLQRIVEVRRIVTGMTRLLGAKHQVVGRLRKRLEEGDGEGGEAAYVGDVEDHILLLQTSLYHYEYILAHCQPAYLSHIRWSYNITRRLISKKILVLSTVTVTVLPLQTVTGIFSMNVRIPRNGDENHLLPDGTPAGFTWFGGIVCIVFAVVCLMCGLTRYWRWTARQRYDRHKGKDLPDWWEGFWGWK